MPHQVLVLVLVLLLLLLLLLPLHLLPLQPAALVAGCSPCWGGFACTGWAHWQNL
jgi:hypothetical protein